MVATVLQFKLKFLDGNIDEELLRNLVEQVVDGEANVLLGTTQATIEATSGVFIFPANTYLEMKEEVEFEPRWQQ